MIDLLVHIAGGLLIVALLFYLYSLYTAAESHGESKLPNE